MHGQVEPCDTILRSVIRPAPGRPATTPFARKWGVGGVGWGQNGGGKEPKELDREDDIEYRRKGNAIVAELELNVFGSLSTSMYSITWALLLVTSPVVRMPSRTAIQSGPALGQVITLLPTSSMSPGELRLKRDEKLRMI